MSDFSDAFIARNPAWIQLLGLCPLLAVSNSVANALGLALASTFVVVGSNVLIAAVRGGIPEFARLPVFVLIIATFTTLTTLLLEAYAYELYLKIALFVQIIVTNCMILGRAEAFASKQPVGRAFMDALGTGLGFAVALLILGAVREVVGQGTLFAELDVLLGPVAQNWQFDFAVSPLPIAQYPPGAFIVAGLLLALGKRLFFRRSGHQDDGTLNILDTTDSQ
ncbi:MAG: electron transport complex subunit RsxE [Pseudomonadales bacterium]|nr:electron transport complex subunit RsxE [Pseudomonadales bacterium]